MAYFFIHSNIKIMFAELRSSFQNGYNYQMTIRPFARRALITSIFLLFFFVVIPATSVFAASPSASLSLSPDKKYINLTFSNLKNVSKVSYVLTYTANNRQTGFEGGFKPNPKTSRTTRRQILGTCSTRFCTYHKNPKGFTLTVTYSLRTGGTTSVTKTL